MLELAIQYDVTRHDLRMTFDMTRLFFFYLTSRFLSYFFSFFSRSSPVQHSCRFDTTVLFCILDYLPCGG